MIRLLGHNDWPMKLLRPAQELAAFLILNHHRWVTREELCEHVLITPKLLRQYLWHLKPLHESILREDGILRWNGYPSDLVEFDQNHDLSLYGGPFLPSFGSDWVVQQRTRLEWKFVDLSFRKGMNMLKEGKLDEAREDVDKALTIVPDDGMLMQLLIRIREAQKLRWLDDYGQGLLEYAVIIAFVAVVVLLVLVFFGQAVGNLYSGIISSL